MGKQINLVKPNGKPVLGDVDATRITEVSTTTHFHTFAAVSRVFDKPARVSGVHLSADEGGNIFVTLEEEE